MPHVNSSAYVPLSVLNAMPPMHQSCDTDVIKHSVSFIKSYDYLPSSIKREFPIKCLL